ncbi:GAF domain-containing protein [Arthrobacter sp. TMN-37]
MSPFRPTSSGDLTSRVAQQRAVNAHSTLGRGEPAEGSLRRVVQESWLRSMRHLTGPERAGARLSYTPDELVAYRESHPLAAVMPVIDRLLIQPSRDSGLVVAVGDEHGRLLWVHGDRTALRRAEDMMFMEGADWSESTVGTSAPGTALALDSSVQIAGAEHFSPQAHPWSCTAVPLHDPDSGTVLGVVDITGTSDAVAGHTLSLVQASVAAAEAQLTIQRLRSRLPAARRPAGPSGAGPALYRSNLQILGTDYGMVHSGGRATELTLRHAELLTLLAMHPEGLSAEQLAVMAYPEHASVTTVRAEMLRLRKALSPHGGDLMPTSRPYRLPQELVVDAVQVLNHLHRGSHRLALEIYRGQVLPRSQAPAITRLRGEVSFLLRDAVLNDGGAAALLQYLQLPEAEFDADAWMTALKVLPGRSPRRSAVVAHIERLERELGSDWHR